MDSVVQHARQGKPVIGICNGFQVLTEIGLLPGALLRNASLRFIHKLVHLRVERTPFPFTRSYQPEEVIELPIAHAQGRYYASPQVLAELESERQILFRYCASDGQLAAAANPNGSLAGIAGICSREGLVMGLMPHPERRLHSYLGSLDGRALFLSIAEAA